MKNKKLKSKYITILRYIFRGTLAFSIYGMFRAIGVYDVTNQSFGLTMLKVLYCGAVMGLSVWALIMIDKYYSRRIESMKTSEVSKMICDESPCDYCIYAEDDGTCSSHICEKCVKGVSEWLNERI